MTAKPSKFGFAECADLVSEQKYGAALRLFQHAAGKFLDAKSPPKRREIARQLQQIGAALEDTLQRAIGENWETHVPRFDDDPRHPICSFCGKQQAEVRKLIAGPSVHICDECIELCKEIVAQEIGAGEAVQRQGRKAESKENRLCGICMEPRKTDELVFLPHAAYMCAGCLEDIQAVRDKQSES